VADYEGKEVSQLTAASTPLAGTEEVHVVQDGGFSRRMTMDEMVSLYEGEVIESRLKFSNKSTLTLHSSLNHSSFTDYGTGRVAGFHTTSYTSHLDKVCVGSAFDVGIVQRYITGNDDQAGNSTLMISMDENVGLQDVNNLSYVVAGPL